jgi:hypothetical protein
MKNENNIPVSHIKHMSNNSQINQIILNDKNIELTMNQINSITSSGPATLSVSPLIFQKIVPQKAKGRTNVKKLLIPDNNLDFSL